MHARDPASRPRCQVLGVPRVVPLPAASAAHVPGGVVTLQRPGGRRQEYILCALVDGTRWWCHPGVSSDAACIFDPDDLELADVAAMAWSAEMPPAHKRLRGRVETKAPRALARSHPGEFATVAAIASWKAEELRAQTMGEVSP